MPKLAFVVLLCAPVCVGAQTPAPSPDPQAVLAAARTALGGEARLSAVKTPWRRTHPSGAGDNLVPIEFEIAIELPSKPCGRTVVPAQESGDADRLQRRRSVEPPNAGPPAGRPAVHHRPRRNNSRPPAPLAPLR